MADIRIILVAESTSIIDNQSVVFKDGFGPGNVKLFKKTDIGQITSFIGLNPTLPVVLFGDSCIHAAVITPLMLTKKYLFLIEPPITPLISTSVKKSVKKGLPPINIQVGPVETRGLYIVDNSTSATPTGYTHEESLSWAGKVIAKSIPPPTQDQLTGELAPESETETVSDEVVLSISEKYTVLKGDYLYKIARKFPIDGVSAKKRVYQIYDANPFMKLRRIESNDKTFYSGENFLEKEDLLFPGDVLEIPGYGTPANTFQISGTVIDDETELPIKGAQIKTNIQEPGFANTTTTDEDGNFTLAGQYVPAEAPTRVLIKRGAKGTQVEELQKLLNLTVDGDFGIITESTVKTYQQENGLKVDGVVGLKTWEVLDNQGQENNPTFIFDIFANALKYNNAQVTPFNQDQTIKDTAGIIRLNSLVVSLKQTEIELTFPEPPQIKQIKEAVTSLDPGTFAVKEISNQVLDRLKTLILPQVLQLLVAFGIGKAQDALGKKLDELGSSCPADLETLNGIIRRKNQLTKMVQQIFDTLDTIKVGVDAVNQVVTVLDIVLQILNPLVALLPVAGFGAPDPPKILLTPGGVLDKLDKIIGKLKLTTSGALLILSIVIALLGKILQMLSLLDSLIQKCYIEGAIPNQTIDPTLLGPPDDDSEKSVNGFTFAVESEPGNIKIKRKRAIAKNKAGITLLKGEWSFSSNDQILIDELVFYIQQNDLKAD